MISWDVMKLALRDLFWLVLVAAMLTAWGLDHYRAAQHIKVLQKEVEWRDNGGHGSISGFPVNIDMIVASTSDDVVADVQSADTAKKLDEAVPCVGRRKFTGGEIA